MKACDTQRKLKLLFFFLLLTKTSVVASLIAPKTLPGGSWGMQWLATYTYSHRTSAYVDIFLASQPFLTPIL